MQPDKDAPIRKQHQPYRWLPLLIAAITAITLGIGAFALHRIETRMVATMGESLALLATDIADKLDHVLFERYADAHIMADVASAKMRDPAALTRYLNQAQERYLLYRWIGVTDANGRVIASTDPASVEQDHRTAAWFQAVRNGKTAHLLDVQDSSEPGVGPAVGFSAPISGPYGEFLGAVTTRVGLRELEDVFGRTVSAFQALRGNNARIEWQFLMRDGTLAADSLLREEGKRNLRQQGLPSALLLSTAAEAGYVEELHARRQVPVITGYARTEGYGEFHGFQWGILVRMDRSEILAPIQSLVWRLGLAGSAVLAPMIGLLLWTTRRVQKEWTNSADQLVRLKGLHAVGQALQQETTGPTEDFALSRFLEFLIDTATRTTSARYGAFGLFDETGKHLVRFITTGMDQAARHAIGTPPTGGGLLGSLAQEADVLRLKDLTRHPMFTGFPPHHPPMRSFLGASVRAHGRVFGRLYLTEKCGADEFTEIDEEVIAALAAQAGVAIENGYFLNQIRAAETQYRTTMAALPVAVVRLDRHDAVRFANRLFCELVQRNETETIGQPIETLLPVEGLSELLCSVRANEAPPVQERECRIPGVNPTTCNVIAQNLRETSELVLVIEDITERKHAEQALRASEERFRQMAEHIKEVIWMTDTAKNQMLYINPAYEKIWGRTCESLYRDPLSFLETIHPDDRERVHAALSKQPSGEYDVEYRIITPDGSPRWICDRAFPIRDASGQVYRIVGIAEDISERKLAQEAVQHSRDFYLKLLDEFPTPIWKSGLDATCDYFNKSWLSFTGRTTEQELGDGWTEGVHPEDLARCVDTYREAFRSTRPFEMEYRLRRHDGVYRSIIDIGRPFYDLTGRFAGYIGVCYDITERKNAEDALRRSEANLNRAQIVAHIGSWHLNIGKNELTWTDEAYRIFDVPTGTPLTYERFLECVHPDDTAYVHQAWTAALRGAPYDIEHRIVTGSEVRWVREKADLEFDDQGRVVAGIGITQDITEHKRAEAALQASEEQLRQAQKMEAVGRLAGGIAHDFNNLLMVMIGYSDALLRRLEHDNPLRRYLLEIKKASDRAASLTHQLLAFSRRQALEPKVLDLNDIVTSMNNMLRRLIGEHIELATSLNSGLGRVKADPGQIEQVIMNLVVNARDAMPDGGTLTVTTDMADIDEPPADSLDRIPPGSYVALAVSDTGHGMDAVTRAHVFEPFFTTKEQGKGTGLGLASVYGIVKQSGGAIAVKSAPQQGATFTVYLPRVADQTVTAAGAEPVRESVGGSETILLAEDEEMVRTLVRETLEEAGYRVMETRSGTEALALGARHADPIHLLLTDVVMPHINGRELADQLINVRPAMKVLYVTGYTDDIVLQQGRLQENAAVIHKPFLPETLLRKVRELLDTPSA